jgi:hypothetical protein
MHLTACTAAIILSFLPGLAAQPVRLVLPEQHGTLMDKAAAIFTRRVNEQCGIQAASSGPNAVTIELRISPGIGAEGFTISRNARGTVRVTGNDERGVLYGLGKLFRTSRCGSGMFSPGSWRGTSRPAASLRGVYLASHFGNFYEAAPIQELETYVEDLALWGVNAVGFAFPAWQYASLDDLAARSNLERIRAMMKATRRTGMQVGAFVAPNQGFKTAPKELRAQPFPDDWGRRGSLGVNVCPSLRAGREYLLDYWERLLNEYRDVGLDFVVYWPYDEGGCGCPQCWPWGARGYVQICRDFSRLARSKYPRCRVVVSTWMFDTPPAGEWEKLTKILAEDRSWVDYIMADAHEDFPRYPLDHGVPGRLPLVNFPEISMWGMAPWGGYGANPLPGHLQHLWKQVAGKISGGFPYSEGIYEDLNKVVYSQFYWDPQRTARETVREYAASEFSPDVADEVLRAVEILEANHRRKSGRFERPPQQTGEAYELLRKADQKLTPQARRSWRWRILYLRVLIDDELCKTGGKPQGPALKEAFAELVRIYHAEHVHTNRVAPPDLLP